MSRGEWTAAEKQSLIFLSLLFGFLAFSSQGISLFLLSVFPFSPKDVSGSAERKKKTLLFWMVLLPYFSQKSKGKKIRDVTSLGSSTEDMPGPNLKRTLERDYPLARNQYINNSPGIFSCICAGKNTGATCIRPELISLKNLANVQKMTPQKYFPVFARVRIQAPHVFAKKLVPQEFFPACIGFVPGGISPQCPHLVKDTSPASFLVTPPKYPPLSGDRCSNTLSHCVFCGAEDYRCYTPTSFLHKSENPRVPISFCPQFWGRRWPRDFYGRLGKLRSFCRKTPCP